MNAENTAKATREFAIRDIMISHCGENLTPDNVDKIAAEILAAIEIGPCAWAFRHNAERTHGARKESL
jgi:hypothetical protein